MHTYTVNKRPDSQRQLQLYNFYKMQHKHTQRVSSDDLCAKKHCNFGYDSSTYKDALATKATATKAKVTGGKRQPRTTKSGEDKNVAISKEIVRR